MLGSPCGCCGQSPCSINGSTPIFPSVSELYACDNANPRGTVSLGIAGAQATGLAAYFDSLRSRSGESLARTIACENVCDSQTLSPQYSFLQSPPTVTVSLTFSGNTTEYKAYHTQFSNQPGSAYGNHCYSFTTICQCSGQYQLLHLGGGVFRYATQVGNDLFEIIASLHRCNNVALWLLSVVFVSRSAKSGCGALNESTITNRCDAQYISANETKILRCCVGHVMHYATACIRTPATFSDRVICGADAPPQQLTIDVDDAGELSSSGSLLVRQLHVTSGNDTSLGNQYGRPGLVLPSSEGGTFNGVAYFYPGIAAPCFCTYPINTFSSVMPSDSQTSYGCQFSITAT
jgi:hypothetical protein